MTDAVVNRLYRCLVEAIRRTRPDGGRAAVSVAEIYQDLVPYRAVRDALGIGLNADYEHAVLRLLAGVGDFVRVEPAEAQEELRRELESPNPNIALFRKFAACDVRIRMPGGRGAATGTGAAQGAGVAGDRAAGGDASGRADAPESPAPPAGSGTANASAPREAAPPVVERPRPAARASAPAARAGGHACAFCGETLPAVRDVRYCPFCGADRRQRPCPACGESLEREWRYCIACGTRIATS